MNKLFYLIYNSYYKDGEYKNDMPNLTVGGIFIVFFCSLFLSGVLLISKLYPTSKHESENKIWLILLILLSSLFTFIRFFYKKKYQQIYNQHKSNSALNSFTGKVIGFTIVILGIISPILCSFLANKLINGRWF